MNYYKARQRESDQRWDYTCQNDNRVWPVGYCGRPMQEEDFAKLGIPMSEREKAHLATNGHKYHTDGHATEAEACECYRQYLLDTQLTLDHEDPHQQRKCQVCEQWTTKFAIFGSTQLFFLCDEHRTREHVEQLTSKIGEIWSS